MMMYFKSHQQFKRVICWRVTYYKFEFKDKGFDEAKKIDTSDILVISNKLASIPHIEFVDEFKDVGSKAFMFLVLTKVVKELVQVSNVRILIIQYFKIRSQVFFNLGRKIRCEQVSISMS